LSNVKRRTWTIIMPAAFHEIRFPLDVSLRGRGGPRRMTDITVTGSGAEERNQRWAHSRRRYEAGYGVTSLEALDRLLAFFEERRGRLYGFRFRDRLDWRSAPPGQPVTAADQAVGTGDGATRAFQLVKTYGRDFAPWSRPIRKPEAGSVKVAVAGKAVVAGVDCDVDPATGIVTFRAGKAPPAGAAVTAGFTFDVPVRFDTDELVVDLEAFAAGEIPSIPLIEIQV
jgi:uncharacterized protein (TIGR02217 family)